MRECKSCLHWKSHEYPNQGMFNFVYCQKHRMAPSEAVQLYGCDDYWPKDGAKCDECRFSFNHQLQSDCVECHHTANLMETVCRKKWFCENWKARE